MASMTETVAVDVVVRWFEDSARTLPWRSDPDPWGVLVSEVMLQQTPVARVLPVYTEWMQRWPTPTSLTADAPGDAIRAWGRLGYPRRALRLHAAAVACRDSFGGAVPSDIADLRSLPGVGEYTAAAVASFAFRQRHAVLDTNVRRVHARWLDGVEFPASSAVNSKERQRALDLLPIEPEGAALVSIAIMELGALVCTARSPKCDACPIAEHCTWRANGYPRWDGPPRRGQTYVGTDRQCRGRLLAALRDADSPLHKSALDTVWSEPGQRERALTGLLADGLVVSDEQSAFRLP
jgi:A/G-specific adenine glycosylase